MTALGAKVNAVDPTGESPVHMAASIGNIEMVVALVEKYNADFTFFGGNSDVWMVKENVVVGKNIPENVGVGKNIPGCWEEYT